MHHTEGYISYEPSNTKHIIWAINPYITFDSPLNGLHIIWSILYRSYHMWILYRYMIYHILHLIVVDLIKAMVVQANKAIDHMRYVDA